MDSARGIADIKTAHIQEASMATITNSLWSDAVVETYNQYMTTELVEVPHQGQRSLFPEPPEYMINWSNFDKYNTYTTTGMATFADTGATSSITVYGIHQQCG